MSKQIFHKASDIMNAAPPKLKIEEGREPLVEFKIGDRVMVANPNSIGKCHQKTFYTMIRIAQLSFNDFIVMDIKLCTEENPSSRILYKYVAYKLKPRFSVVEDYISYSFPAKDLALYVFPDYVDIYNKIAKKNYNTLYIASL